MGDIKVHHFAHKGHRCEEEAAFDAGLYAFLKQLLDSGAQMHMPDGDEAVFDGAEIVSDEKGRAMAMMATRRNKKTPIKLWLPNARSRPVPYKGEQTLILDLRELGGHIYKWTSDKLASHLLSDECKKFWISPPKYTEPAHPGMKRQMWHPPQPEVEDDDIWYAEKMKEKQLEKDKAFEQRMASEAEFAKRKNQTAAQESAHETIAYTCYFCKQTKPEADFRVYRGNFGVCTPCNTGDAILIFLTSPNLY
ncbi:MAG: hypothetical protein FWC67_03710 [Defluviitaleaceae bacterium]|nr:hypothetical protein [Defluviitaleaceae bacterium]